MTARPRIRASDYAHLLQHPPEPPPGSAAASALKSYRSATGAAPSPKAEPKAGSAAAKAVALYRRLTGSTRR